MNILAPAVPVSYPSAQPRSTAFAVRINGEPADVLLADKADFVMCECSGPAEITVLVEGDADGAVVRPLAQGIVPSVVGGAVRFAIDGPRNLCLEIPGRKPLFIYANAPETARPSPGDPAVRYFAAGRVHEVGEIVLRDGETLYIEAGAVVRGHVRATGAANVAIRGQGVLDGRQDGRERVRSVIFERCTGVSVSGIVMIEPTSWMLVLACCRGVHIDGLRQIGSCMSSDGIDICGSSDVLVENCCLRNDDDNIAVKSGVFERTRSWQGDVAGVLVRDCIFYNGQPGNVMEIGYELSADRIADIAFENIDVIGAHGEGAVFSIHNGDRAVVENIRWENIRVEHYWDKLVDLRVVKARYNRDPERGHIRGVLFKDIAVTHSVFNPGCSISVMSGHTPDKPVCDVVFDNFRLNGRRVASADDLELHLRNVEGLRFR